MLQQIYPIEYRMNLIHSVVEIRPVDPNENSSKANVKNKFGFIFTGGPGGP